MSESMSSPWIRDYLVDVAETYGVKLYDAPAVSRKKKVQLTDFLTYQENSYVWAWISDKEHRVSVRISKDAASVYKSLNSRNILDSRFSLVIISSYRPMFSPRPLGPNTSGNTPMSHLSLEVGDVKLMGVGGHLFGNPRDLESDENMKEWVLGLRQDGGGGNILMLRKQQELVQNKKAPPPPPSPPPFSLYAPVSQCQATKPAENTAKPKREQPQDFKRAYTKRWRTVEASPWKFATKPAVEERANLLPTPLHHTPSPTSQVQRQGTPTNWSPSNRGSPAVPDKATTIASGNGIRQDEEAEVLPTTPHLPSDTEGHVTVDAVAASDTHSLQPPTPAQRIKRSSPSPFTSPPRSSAERSARSPPLPSQLLPCSFPPPPSSSLPLPSSSLSMPISIRKNIQRRVPHPGLPVAQSEPTSQGPAQILVPNSDTSVTGSFHPHSQSQHPSQSQQSQRQLLSHLPAFPSSLAKDFNPLDASTPREAMPRSLTRRTSKMFAESLPTHRNINEQETTSTDDKSSTEKPETNIRKQDGSNSTRSPAPSTPKIEVLEVGTSDTEEESEPVQPTRNTARQELDLDKQNGTQDTGKGDVDADRGDNQSPVDKVRSPPRRPLPTVPIMQQPPSKDQHTGGVSIQHFTQSSERPGSRSSMYSLFSGPPADERIPSSYAPVPSVDRKEDKVQEKTSPAHVPRHDPEAWKKPSFLARSKGKGKARAAEEPDTQSVRVNKKRRRSAQPDSPSPKQAKVVTPEVSQVPPGQTTAKTTQGREKAFVSGESHSSYRPSMSPTGTTEVTTPSTAFQSSKPRLANFAVDFERIELGKRVPTPMVDMEKDIRSILLRTGRIRTLGEEVEEDGSAYTMR